MKRYNNELNKYKGLYYTPYTMLKAYIFAVIMALIITLPMYLVILNIIYLSHHFKIVLLLIVLNSLLLCYLILYFKDKYLLDNVEGAKDVDLFFIRIVDIFIVALVVFIMYGLYLIIRR